MNLNPEDVPKLLQAVRQAPNAALSGKIPEVFALAEIGAPVVDAVLAAMRLPAPEGQHQRDVIEALGRVLTEVAKQDPAPLLAILDQDTAQADPQLTFIVFALSGAKPAEVTPHLLKAQRHLNVWVRYAAAEVLAGFGTTAARGAMITALRDRSPMVKFVAVEALAKKRGLWSEEAVPYLRKIATMPSVAKHSPGMLRMVEELLRQNGPACAGPI